MLSVMIIGGFVNDINTNISMDKQQCIEVAELGSGDIDPVLFIRDINRKV